MSPTPKKNQWDDSHRLWPLPHLPWNMKQTWNDLLFIHYPIKLEKLRSLVPDVLPLDSFEGFGWLGIVPFKMTGVGLRGIPPIPGTDCFPELNVRTYITIDGKPGVYFFSLDAANWLAVKLAKTFYHLPYKYADIQMYHNGNTFEFESIRRGNLDVKFSCHYKAISETFQASKGTFEEWLTERYCFYTINKKGMPLRCDILHAPWELQAAEAEIYYNSLLSSQGVQVASEKPIFHFSKQAIVRAWPLVKECME